MREISYLTCIICKQPREELVGVADSMSRSNDAGHFFQTSESLATSERKSAKAKNKEGNPIKLPSKILAAQADPSNGGALFVAEAEGEVKRVVVEVCKRFLSHLQLILSLIFLDC